jgi:hypothetical protein
VAVGAVDKSRGQCRKVRGTFGHVSKLRSPSKQKDTEFLERAGGETAAQQSLRQEPSARAFGESFRQEPSARGLRWAKCLLFG